jgi:hypothetical protein
MQPRTRPSDAAPRPLQVACMGWSCDGTRLAAGRAKQAVIRRTHRRPVPLQLSRAAVLGGSRLQCPARPRTALPRQAR